MVSSVRKGAGCFGQESAPYPGPGWTVRGELVCATLLLVCCVNSFLACGGSREVGVLLVKSLPSKPRGKDGAQNPAGQSKAEAQPATSRGGFGPFCPNVLAPPTHSVPQFDSRSKDRVRRGGFGGNEPSAERPGTPATGSVNGEGRIWVRARPPTHGAFLPQTPKKVLGDRNRGFRRKPAPQTRLVLSQVMCHGSALKRCPPCSSLSPPGCEVSSSPRPLSLSLKG